MQAFFEGIVFRALEAPWELKVKNFLPIVEMNTIYSKAQSLSPSYPFLQKLLWSLSGVVNLFRIASTIVFWNHLNFITVLARTSCRFISHPILQS